MTIRIRPSMLKDKKTIDLLLRGGAMIQVVGRVLREAGQPPSAVKEPA